MSPYFLEYANKELTGTTIKNVSLKTMRNFQIPLPSLPEQQQIVSDLDKLSQTINNLKTVYKSQLAEYDALWASTLDKAFRGELVS
jgi:type I restriction enzyme S subunit